MSADLIPIVFELVKLALSDWPEPDVQRYFELAYQDCDMSLFVRTDSSRAAQIIAQGVSDMMIERMRYLRAKEERLIEAPRRIVDA